MSVALDHIAQLWRWKCSVEYVRDLYTHEFVTLIILIYVFIFAFFQREKVLTMLLGDWPLQGLLMDYLIVRLQEMNVRNESWEPDMFELLWHQFRVEDPVQRRSVPRWTSDLSALSAKNVWEQDADTLHSMWWVGVAPEISLRIIICVWQTCRWKIKPDFKFQNKCQPI